MDGVYWFRAHWYIIPEETASGRQPHNLRRELYRTNDFADVEVIILAEFGILGSCFAIFHYQSFKHIIVANRIINYKNCETKKKKKKCYAYFP